VPNPQAFCDDLVKVVLSPQNYVALLIEGEPPVSFNFPFGGDAVDIPVVSLLAIS
jgi:hypothetical protein